MGWFFGLPPAIRLLSFSLVGACLGSLINWAIYQVCWNPRSISPWSVPDPKAPQRHWSDRIPIIGWFGLAREKEVHGQLFWIRPLLIESACGMGLAWLYLFEVFDKGLHDWLAAGLPKAVVAPPVGDLHSQFLAHAILFGLLIAATFIDLDEKTIPDLITIPGTIIAWLLASLLPNSLLSDFAVTGGPGAREWVASSLRLTVVWPVWLNGPYGLLVAALCLIAWWYALLPKLFYFRGGIAKGLRLLFAKMIRYRFTLYLSIVLLAAVAYSAAIWAWGTPNQWSGLLSSLVGMAFGGAIVWAFRVVASAVLNQEAMGFGDVTLMGMIGAYVGWQPVLLIFFIAPFAGMIIALAQWVITRKHEIAYGPYLAFATVLLILNWPLGWMRVCNHFDVLGIWIPGLLIVCLVPMALMLMGWMWIKRRWLGR